ncbi:hypothetical protein D9615_003268 [Tricholomella constricta]|uniref:Uncharacterized protein n=1 Tax=Tricholomella constricta TaxID=117010 RepID=A0A8H5M817_9AGAR|nr:hypothetical protein D9615_003268 [Tricholomella constricta]
MEVDTPEPYDADKQDRDGDDGDADDANPNDDPDMEPAHRAEALDFLATSELEFALLRERLYVEKMEGLAWEEALSTTGALEQEGQAYGVGLTPTLL